jgi:protein-arginine kinase activator protein McsA
MPEVMYRVAREYDVVTVRITDQVKQRIDQLRLEGRCLGCQRQFEAGEKTCRGQCKTCYPNTARKIRDGKVNENQLIREGKLLPAGTGGRKPTNDYTRELAEM